MNRVGRENRSQSVIVKPGDPARQESPLPGLGRQVTMSHGSPPQKLSAKNPQRQNVQPEARDQLERIAEHYGERLAPQDVQQSMGLGTRIKNSLLNGLDYVWNKIKSGFSWLAKHTTHRNEASEISELQAARPKPLADNQIEAHLVGASGLSPADEKMGEEFHNKYLTGIGKFGTKLGTIGLGSAGAYYGFKALGKIGENVPLLKYVTDAACSYTAAKIKVTAMAKQEQLRRAEDPRIPDLEGEFKVKADKLYGELQKFAMDDATAGSTNKYILDAIRGRTEVFGSDFEKFSPERFVIFSKLMQIHSENLDTVDGAKAYGEKLKEGANSLDSEITEKKELIDIKKKEIEDTYNSLSEAQQHQLKAATEKLTTERSLLEGPGELLPGVKEQINARIDGFRDEINKLLPMSLYKDIMETDLELAALESNKRQLESASNLYSAKASALEEQAGQDHNNNIQGNPFTAQLLSNCHRADKARLNVFEHSFKAYDNKEIRLARKRFALPDTAADKEVEIMLRKEKMTIYREKRKLAFDNLQTLASAKTRVSNNQDHLDVAVAQVDKNMADFRVNACKRKIAELSRREKTLVAHPDSTRDGMEKLQDVQMELSLYRQKILPRNEATLKEVSRRLDVFRLRTGIAAT